MGPGALIRVIKTQGYTGNVKLRYYGRIEEIISGQPTLIIR